MASTAYDQFAARQRTKSRLQSVAVLKRGTLYKVTKFETQPSQYLKKGKPVTNLVAHYTVHNFSFFSYLPSDFDNPDQKHVEEMNQDIDQSKPPTICFYGKMGGANIVKIHAHGQTVDEQLLTDIERMEQVRIEQESPQKRQASDESPAKIPKLEGPP